MPNPLTAFGGAPAGGQVLDFGVRALRDCFTLVQDLKNAPKHVKDLKGELESSINRMVDIRKTMVRLTTNRLDPTSKDRISRVESLADDLQESAEKLQRMLMAITSSSVINNRHITTAIGAVRAVVKEKDIREEFAKILQHQDVLSAELNLASVVVSNSNRYVQDLYRS